MTKKSISVVLVCTVFICLSILFITTVNSPDYVKKNSSLMPDTTKIADDDTKNVSVPNTRTEVYILRLSADTDTVELVFQKEDGTQIISAVDSINPYYLTEEDVKALELGIEMADREDMYILIEDLSS